MTVHPKPQGFREAGTLSVLGSTSTSHYRVCGLLVLSSSIFFVAAGFKCSGRVLSSPRNLQPEKYHKIVPKVKTLFLGDLVKTARKSKASPPPTVSYTGTGSDS